MTEKEEIFAVLRAALPDLKRRWPISSLAVFGSVARGEASAASDVDVLVDFARPLALSEFLALEDVLSALVTMAAVRNRIVHAYFGIDDTILFTTIGEEVTVLSPHVEALARQHDVKI